MRKKLFSIILAVITIFTCMMFTACREEKKPTKYTVNFDSMGGTEVLSQQIEKNKTVAQPIDPTKEGYVFMHWYLYDPAVEFDFVNYKVNSNITLKAYWKEYTGTYTITYKVGDEVYCEQEVDINTYATKPTNPTQEGRSFIYWYSDLDDGAFDFATTKIRKDIILYAKFLLDEVVDGQILYYLDGASINISGLPAGGSITAQSGDTVQLPILVPEIEEDEFLGWVNATTGEKYLIKDYQNSADYKFVYDGKALLMYALWNLAPQVIV